ncbi:hypothetical protein B9Y72_08315 [Stenotrophomonas maltophilia]|nr:hypothetical protein B9Y68_08315 [Stenotrophomonas maltophilia]PJL21813.1 hypothetical protein B9Y72_08315 [Stenotrophomonas maltophilia]
MDAAAKPPWTGSRRPPQPDPPRHPTGTPLLLWLLLSLLRLPASGRHYRGARGTTPQSNTPLTSLNRSAISARHLH